MSFRHNFILVLAIAALAAAPAGGQTTRYFNVPSGSYDTAGNWNPSGVPGESDTAAIGHSSGASNCTATLAASGGATNRLYVGYNTTGTLSLSAGGSLIVKGPAYIGGYGSLSVGNGTITVSGGTLEMKNYIYLGRTSGSTGTLTQTGGLIKNINYGCYVGEYGTGVYDISNGGTYDSNVPVWIGNNPGSSGTMTVGGASTVVTTRGNLQVGVGGTGEFRQTDGTVNVGAAALSSNPCALYLGVNDSGSGTYALEGGTLNLISNVESGTITHRIGARGDGNFVQTGGAVNVGDGGYAVQHDLAIGGQSGFTTGYGLYSITGAGSSLDVYGDLWVGVATANGNKFTQDGGDVNVHDCIYVGGASGAYGEYRFNGGTLTVGNAISGGAGTSFFYFNGGTIKAANDSTGLISGLTYAHVQSGGVVIDTDGHDVAVGQAFSPASGDGGVTKLGAGTLTLTGSNTYVGATVIQAGTLELGPSAHNAVLAIGGANVKAAGKLIFDYTGSLTPIAAVRGALYSGKIYSSDATSSHGLGYADEGSSQVKIEYAYYGDSDLDGDVDNSDFGAVYGSFTGPSGANKFWTTGDFDYDGDVDNSDFGAVYGNYTGPLTGGMKMMSALSGNPDIADLIYDPATGNVKLDATEAAGAVITNFVLQNAAGGDDFVTGVVNFPFGSFVKTDLPTEISDTDLTTAGFSGVWDLGNIFPTGFNETSLAAWLTKATYVGSLGSGQHTFDLTVVPEPGTLILLAAGLIGLVAYAWRKRQ